MSIMMIDNGTIHMMMMRGRRMGVQIRMMVMMTTMARWVLGGPQRLQCLSMMMMTSMMMVMMMIMIMMMLMMMVRGPGKAPALLSGGDCSAVSQFIPGKDLQEVLPHHRIMIKSINHLVEHPKYFLSVI